MGPAAASPPQILGFQADLRARGAALDGTQVLHFGDRAAELAALPRGPTVHPLTTDGLIGVSGADAAAFLQGQLTNDVHELDTGRAQLSAYCTPQGRILATLLVWRAGNAYLLQLPRELSDGIRTRLRRYVLRARVEVVDASASAVLLGLGGPGAAGLLGNLFGQSPAEPMAITHVSDATLICLGTDLFELAVEPQRATAVWDRLAQHATPAGTPGWQWRLIGAPIPVVTAPTQEQFVPQMANLEQLGAVNFSKGCYPGQEVVARSQYRGEVKRRLFRFHAELPTAAPGQPLYSGEVSGQAVGVVVNAAPAPSGGLDLLAVVRIDQAGSSSLRLGAPDGCLLRGLPLHQADSR
jgi:hypothetical protein